MEVLLVLTSLGTHIQQQVVLEVEWRHSDVSYTLPRICDILMSRGDSQ